MGRRILIVDDAAFMRAVLKNLLSRSGYRICGEASTGEEAIEKYIELKPDLVTMDITMNGMDGIEALRKIVQIDKSAKVIMCSAMGQQDLVIESIQGGARDFIVKPFSDGRVLSAVRRQIG
jgi:two-component system chemotaxis response regulator CheY